MKALGLLFALMPLTSFSTPSVDCSKREVQFAGFIRNINETLDRSGKLYCAYQVRVTQMSSQRGNTECAISYGEMDHAILIEDGSCASAGLEKGAKKMGRLVVKDGQYFLD